MSFFSLSLSGSGQLDLGGELTIYGALELKRRLLEALHQNGALEIELTGVSELDCAGVQVLLLVQKEALALGKTISWKGHSEAMSRVLEQLNLGSALGAPASLIWS